MSMENALYRASLLMDRVPDDLNSHILTYAWSSDNWDTQFHIPTGVSKRFILQGNPQFEVNLLFSEDVPDDIYAALKGKLSNMLNEKSLKMNEIGDRIVVVSNESEDENGNPVYSKYLTQVKLPEERKSIFEEEVKCVEECLLSARRSIKTDQFVEAIPSTWITKDGYQYTVRIRFKWLSRVEGFIS
jgi:hypothetical protein